MPHVLVRPAQPEDIAALREIQAAAPAASQWAPESYLGYDCRVAVIEGSTAGFLVARSAGGETEILNLAVAPAFRRRGVGRELVHDLARRCPGPVFLEVRESNAAACEFYRSLGFRVVGRRPEYYHSPAEAAVVMKMQSC